MRASGASLEPVVQGLSNSYDTPVALSPDGRFLAVCNEMQTAIYATQSGQLRRVLPGGGNPSWSPDGSVLAVGGEGVRLWRMPAATLLRFEGRGAGRVDFDRSGRRFTCDTRGLQGRMAIFETHSRRVAPLGERSEWDNYADYDSDRVLLRGDARQILTWNAHDYKEGKPTVRATLWDTKSGRVARTWVSETPLKSVAWSPDGRFLALGQERNTLDLWNVQDGSRKRLLNGPTGGVIERVWNVAFSGDGKTLVSSSDDGTMRFWSVPSGDVVKKMPLPPGVDSYFFSASKDLHSMAFRSHRNGVALLDGDGKEPVVLPAALPSIESLAWLPDGSCLAHGAGTNVRIWDWRRGRLRAAPPTLGYLAGLAFREGELRAALGIIEDDSSRGEIWAWNSEGQLRASWLLGTIASPKERTENAPTDFSPGGAWTVQHGIFGNEFLLRDARTGRQARDLKVPEQGMAFAFGGDTHAVTAERNETIRLWNLRAGTHRVIHRSDHRDNDFEAKVLAVSRNFHLVAGGGQDGLRVWTATGAPREQQLSDDFILALDFFNETWLAAANAKGEIALWQCAPPGRAKMRRVVLGRPGNGTRALRFSPDGKYLASGGSDGTLRIWDIARAASGKPALRLTIWNNWSQQSGPQWFACTPDNRWTASADAAQFVAWRTSGAPVDAPLLPLETQAATRDDTILQRAKW